MTRLAADHETVVSGQKEDQRALAEAHWIAGTSIGYCFATPMDLQNIDPDIYTICIGSGSSASQEEDGHVFLVSQAPKKHLSYFSSQIENIEKGLAEALGNSRSIQIVWPKDNSSNERDFGIGILLIAFCESGYYSS